MIHRAAGSFNEEVAKFGQLILDQELFNIILKVIFFHLPFMEVRCHLFVTK